MYMYYVTFDPGAGARDVPEHQKSLHYHEVLGRNWSNSRLATPLGNPGSANVLYTNNTYGTPCGEGKRVFALVLVLF